MNDWDTVASLTHRIMALPADQQGPLIAELSCIADKLHKLGVLLEDMQNNLKFIETQSNVKEMSGGYHVD